jgi:hypothetical protein
MAATMNAIQVRRSVSREIVVTGALRDVRPSRRRSITVSVPNTVTIAITWIDSSNGKADAELAM